MNLSPFLDLKIVPENGPISKHVNPSIASANSNLRKKIQFSFKVAPGLRVSCLFPPVHYYIATLSIGQLTNS